MRLNLWNPLHSWRKTERTDTSPFLDLKIKRVIHDFRAHLRVDRGFTDDTTHGYGSHLAAAMRRLRRSRLSERLMRNYLLWMRDEDYSYSAQLNTTLAFEAYGRMRRLY